MITTSLISIAIWTSILMSHDMSLINDLRTAKSGSLRVEDRVVVRETTFSEKFGLGVEQIARPDAEIAALQADARRFASTIDLQAQAKDVTWETPSIHRKPGNRMNWNERFDFKSEDDGGYYFAGKHFPMEYENPFLCQQGRLSIEHNH